MDNIEEKWADCLQDLKIIFDANYDVAFGPGHTPDFAIMADAFAEYICDNRLQGRLKNLEITDLVDYFLDLHENPAFIVEYIDCCGMLRQDPCDNIYQAVDVAHTRLKDCFEDVAILKREVDDYDTIISYNSKEEYTPIWSVYEPNSQVVLEMEAEKDLDELSAGEVLEAVLDKNPDLKGRSFVVEDDTESRLFLCEFDTYAEFKSTGWEGGVQ